MTTLSKGDRVVVVKRDGKLVEGTFSHIAPNGKAYIKGDDKIGYERGLTSLKKIGEARTDFNIQTQEGQSEPTQQFNKPKQDFDINQRFQFLEQLVRMVVNSTSTSLVVTGEGGLGKTHTVKETLYRKRLVEDEQWIHIKGYSTPRGLYRTLYENSDKICVFDDCDSILEDKVALNLLKGALDSYDKSVIHWASQSFDESLPPYFEFTGKIIFISNKNMASMNQAILSRSNSVDLTMSLEDKLVRMKAILPNIKTFVPMEVKEECLNLVKEYSDQCHDLNIRTLMKTIDIRIDPENNENWKDLAVYTMTNTIS